MLVDSNLPVDRDRLKNRLIRLVKEDEEILGCFFSGSIGTKTEDNYSDIDARIIVKDNINLKRKQVEIIRAIGKYLFIEKLEEKSSIIHYDTFIKLDLFVYTVEDLTPSIWMKNIAIVKDFGLLEDLSKKSQSLNYSITQKEFDELINNYYADYFELYRCWKREEYNYLEQLILSMKHCLVSMWYVSKGFAPNPAMDWAKYEGRKTKLTHLEANFILSYTPFELEQLEEFTKKMEILVFEAAEKISTYNRLSFSQETFKKVHRRISFKVELPEENKE
ncbi:nucleotidyltransferase domain-containing protein [Vagococcus fluvialis]|uniref:nucleotidyltransferase domain-containing protein n=1 Tax=Vagococcus fluvialis TaxID=2738 RepID=UPI0014331699|nr:nucleotidyltransferase domain-containing protein [Vagococcus fluvialis]MBO0444201.1 nucleotidyltransferase domain-containing protein [Vagococcus fluvialis]MBO0488394.1 nucleotidyltransferase domain-containing protein [Vagococcus fluvialis]NKC60324.1 nucleotidyltransferase domain-containing protein [Vagococcus fluvialis]NKD51106.1 nucleotidyltransferase domain-containing protein [Vagococcus fluvialis]